MRFKVEANYLIRTENIIEVDPYDFLHCATIEELHDEIEVLFYDNTIPDFISKNSYTDVVYQENLGIRYYDTWFETDDGKNFFKEWQKLKGLPQEL